MLLHNPISGAIVLAASSSLDALEATDAESQVLRDLWKDAGLFETVRPRPTTEVDLTEAPCTTLVFRGPNAAYAVELPVEDLLIDQLTTILSHQLCAKTDENLPLDTQVCRLETVGDIYSAFEDGIPSSGDMTRDDARFHIIRRVAETIYGPDQVAMVCHASAVAHNGRALIFLGTSGRGKTTTALGLLAAGCRQIADDHVPVTFSGTSVLGFPGAIALKSGTWGLAEAQPFLNASTLQEVRDGSRYVSAANPVDTGDCLPIAALVFPNFEPDYDPDAAAQLTRMLPEEVLVAAVEAGARIAPGAKTARPLTMMCNTIPAWQLTYSTSQQSIPACLSLLNA